MAWVVIDLDGGSEEDYQKLQNLQLQIGHHPSVISLETGMLRTPMVIGITAENATTVDQAVEEGGETLFLDGSLAQRLQHEGVTSGVAIAAFIDGQNSEAAIQFMDDLDLLMERTKSKVWLEVICPRVHKPRKHSKNLGLHRFYRLGW